MNDQELLRGARECTTISGDCANCPFDRHIGADGAHCPDLLVRALAERVEKLSEHSARYAEELAVIQERERWITVEERLPEAFVSVLAYSPEEAPLPTVHECYIDTEGGWHRLGVFSIARVTHWRPLPEEAEGGRSRDAGL